MNINCRKLKKASKYVKSWLQKQSFVKEESITDWLLFNVSEELPEVKYVAFTRNEEAQTTGADWEWWFVFNKISFKLRVQAKKVKNDSDNYSSIAYANKNGLQIEKLLNDADYTNSIPLYAFYSSKDAVTKCSRGFNDEGVFIAGAKEVFEKFIKNGKVYVGNDSILGVSIPLSCVVCCPLCNDGENGMRNFFQTYFSMETTFSDNGTRRKAVGEYTQLPNYVDYLVRYADDKKLDWFDMEFRHDIADVNSIVVFDFRENE